MAGRRMIVLLGALAVLAGASVAVAASLPLSSAKLTVFRTCTLSATSSSSLAATDTYADQSAPTTNRGNGTALRVETSTAANRRVYLRFDLTRCNPAIPSSATVQLATLRLFVTTLPTACRTHDIFRVASSWVETTLTWNNQPFGTTLNNPPSSQRTAAMSVGASPCTNSTNTTYVSGWNVTVDVQAFVSGSAANNGWMIRDDVEASASTFACVYASRDNNQVARAPQLIVVFSV